MGRRANFQWTASAPANWTAVAAGANALSVLWTSTDPGTIRRLIVDCYIQTQSPADGVNVFGRCGIIVADNTVASAGVAALSKPLTNGDQEWLWNRGYAKFIEGTEAFSALHLHDDVRGMRKFKQTDTLCFVIENQAGSAGVRFFFSVRSLQSS